MQLSKRLLAVSEMVPANRCLADIGTDHGYIPIYLVKQKRISYAYACDVNPGPLLRAKENIKAHNLGAYIETRRSDGLNALSEGEADCIVIAGMGGSLIQRILTEGERVLRSVKELILSPQSELTQMRHFLEEHGYRILEERMLKDEGKYYNLMKVVHGSMHYEREIDYRYGKELLDSRDTCLLEFLNKEERTCEEILEGLLQSDTHQAEKRAEEIREELCKIRLAKEEMEE